MERSEMSIIKYLPLALLLLAGPAAAQTSGGIAQSGHFQNLTVCRTADCGRVTAILDPCQGACPGCGGVKCGQESDAMSAAESDLMWQLHLKANADFVDIDGKMYLRMNPEARALWQLLHKEH
jgi:hypothetical protein